MWDLGFRVSAHNSRFLSHFIELLAILYATQLFIIEQ